MPDILDMIAQNPEMAQSLDQAPQATPSYTVAPSTPEQDRHFQDEWGDIPAFVHARASRSAKILSDPNLQASIETHHQAVADANAYHHQASQELAYLHAAHTYHDTGAFYQAAHGIDPNDPQYEDKMLGLAAKYPYAKPDAALMQPLHEARRTVLTANSAIERRKQDSEIQAAMEKGHLTLDDLANYSTPNGLNYQALKFLAGSRAGSGVQNLNETERNLLKVYGTPDARTAAYNKVARMAANGDQDAAAQNNTIWNTWKRAGFAAQTNQSNAAPSSAASFVP